MSRATLKDSLGEGGAFIADDHGDDNLIDVLKALAEGGSDLDAYQETIATATLASKVMDKPSTLHSFRTHVATTGTNTPTTVDLVVNGTVVAQLTTDETDPDGTLEESSDSDLPLALAAGDLVQLVVSAAPTGGAGLTASVRISGVTLQTPSS